MVLQRKKKGDNKGRNLALQIKGTAKGEKGDNKESGNRGYTDQGYSKGRRRPTMTRAETEAIQIKRPAEGGEGRQQRERKHSLHRSRVPQREEKGENKESGGRGEGENFSGAGGGGRGEGGGRSGRLKS